jgi:hypothetical protein
VHPHGDDPNDQARESPREISLSQGDIACLTVTFIPSGSPVYPIVLFVPALANGTGHIPTMPLVDRSLPIYR